MKYTLTIAAALVWASWTAAAADREIDETRAASPRGTVNVKNVVGSVEIVAWDRNEVNLKGRIEEDVERVEFEADGEDIEIEVVVPRQLRNHRAGAYLTLQVPRESKLDVETVSAPVTVTGVRGDPMEVQTVNGKIEITEGTGAVEVQTINGEIRLRGDYRNVQASTVNGQIDVDRVQERVVAETISGGVTVVAGQPNQVEISGVSASVRYEGGLGPGGRFEAEVFSGNVNVHFTHDVFGRYDISTFSGGIECDFGPEVRRTGRFGPGRELRFTHGEGNARVSIETFSGSVTIKRQ